MARRHFFRYSLLAAVGFLFFGVTSLVSGWMRYGEVSVPAVLEILLALVIVIGRITVSSGYQKRLTDQLESLAYCMESTTKTAVLNFPAPMVVVSPDGAIQWYNRSFAGMVGRENLYEEYLQDIFPELQFSRFVENDAPSPTEYLYKDRSYLVSGQMVQTTQNEITESMIGLYFSDMTEIREYEKRLADEKVVVCSVMVDNYEEVFKGTPNINHGALIAEIERCINEWVERGEGVSIRYERDRFLVLFETAKFARLIQEKFAILQEIKAVEKGNRFPVTLSIGVGSTGGTVLENQQMSLTALDVALGRGGDQAVVKNPSGFQFYGAKSQEIEKSTKVKARVVAHALRDLADQASKVIIMGHRNGDADSVGASAGLLWALRCRRVDAYIACDRNHSNATMLLEGLLRQEDYATRIINEESALSMIDDKTLLIVVDTHRPGMVEYPDLLRNVEEVVLIDHHRRGEDFIEGTVLSYHEPYASSSSEMVTELLQYMVQGRTMNVLEAEALYSGIYIDTKGFTFKTGVRTFEAASYLRKMGADPIDVRRQFRNDLDMYILKSSIISRAKIYRDNIALAVCDDIGTETQLVVAQAADELLNIKGIEAAFVLAAMGSKIVISGRSLDSVNVQVILEKLGGGGHITIAGAQIKNNGLELAEMQLRSAIDEVLFDEVPK